MHIGRVLAGCHTIKRPNSLPVHQGLTLRDERQDSVGLKVFQVEFEASGTQTADDNTIVNAHEVFAWPMTGFVALDVFRA